MKWKEGRSTKYDVRHFLFVLLLRCDQLFVVMFHTVNVAIIFVVVCLLPGRNVVVIAYTCICVQPCIIVYIQYSLSHIQI